MAGRIIEPGGVKAHDQAFMQKALGQALKAFEADEIPIGAIVVSPEGNIIGAGYNQTELQHSQSRHAEVLAIEQAGKVANTWRLSDCTMYVTVQPCLMCMGLICLSRIMRVVYGAESPVFGYDLGKEGFPAVYQKHLKGISSGVLNEESQRLLEEFFKKRRKEG